MLVRIIFIFALVFINSLIVDQSIEAAKTQPIEVADECILPKELQSSPSEDIFFRSTDNGLIQLPSFVTAISSTIRDMKKENPEAGSRKNPIEVEGTEKTLLKVAIMMNKLLLIAKDKYGKGIKPQEVTPDQTIFISEEVSREISGFFPAYNNSCSSAELERIYLAVRELNIRPLTNALAKEIVERVCARISQSRYWSFGEGIKNHCTLQKALELNRFNQISSDEEYIKMHFDLFKENRVEYSIADYLGQQGQPQVEQEGESKKLRLISDKFTSLKGMELLDPEGITSLELSSKFIDPKVDPDCPREPFRQFKDLKTLSFSLSYSRWSEFPTTFFNGLCNLQELQLGALSIDRLYENTFESMKELTRLRLANVNSEGWLYVPLRFDKLEYLDISSERISDCERKLPLFMFAENLKKIKLNCNLKAFPGTFFSNYPNLEVIDLHQNSLKRFPWELKRLHKLWKIIVDPDLSPRSLRNLRRNLPENIKEIHYTGYTNWPNPTIYKNKYHWYDFYTVPRHFLGKEGYCGKLEGRVLRLYE